MQPMSSSLHDSFPTHISKIQDIQHQYDAFIIDLWGVVHNGIQAFPGALRVLESLKSLNKPVVFLSNAPRREEPARKQLIERGVPEDLYSAIYTSGEDCHRHLKLCSDDWYACLGKKLYHLGPDKDKSIFENVPFYEENDLKKADFILNTGIHSWENTVEDYEDLLQQGVELKLPMICPNPDKIVIVGTKPAVCAGALAARYEELGGMVRYHGKPFPAIYEAVLSLLDPVEKSRVLIIGDSLSTDIKGANIVNIDSVFILSGIHGKDIEEGEEKEASLTGLFQRHSAYPTFLCDFLDW